MAKGLGSKIEKITKATGIKTVVDKVSEITGKDCGCDKRKKTLDELYPAKGYLRPSEYEYVKDTDGESLTSKISAKDTMYVSAIQELLTKIDALEARVKELEK